MIKMIALDLDGTLLNSQKKISPRTVATLHRLQQQGLKIVLCTGRAINAISDYLQQLNLMPAGEFVSTFNGALVRATLQKTPLLQINLAKSTMQPLFTFAQQVKWPVDVLDFEQVYHITDLGPSLYQAMNPNLKVVATTAAQLPEQHDYSKLVIATEPKQINQALSSLPEELKAGFNVASSRTNLLEFVPKTVTKANALDVLLTHLGWNRSNLMAFGDQANDLSMIAAANVGVAMANAIPAVKAVAEQTTLTNDQDGVAVFLDDYFQLN
ncbi:Cof-type HAD-IIB family hydrolase [Loigolactobacillus iwatensis]|uniref:Cof-type HAD-IIB family hydrolase n=1 Tax=Loigolactobacillus iwatensis TaxID=1267156 RepID=UPI000F7EA2B1|nr:Cof-type HAD-IIB family hydrolase [Loigolactobacillus iwatensis]